MERLYGVGLDEFVAARTAAARELREQGRRDEAAAVQALRKPSVAAWIVNRLARDEAELVAELLSVGVRLRKVQLGAGSPVELRSASEAEQAALDALMRAAARVARRSVGWRLAGACAGDAARGGARPGPGRAGAPWRPGAGAAGGGVSPGRGRPGGGPPRRPTHPGTRRHWARPSPVAGKERGRDPPAGAGGGGGEDRAGGAGRGRARTGRRTRGAGGSGARAQAGPYSGDGGGAADVGSRARLPSGPPPRAIWPLAGRSRRPHAGARSRKPADRPR